MLATLAACPATLGVLLVIYGWYRWEDEHSSLLRDVTNAGLGQVMLGVAMVLVSLVLFGLRVVVEAMAWQRQPAPAAASTDD